MVTSNFVLTAIFSDKKPVFLRVFHILHSLKQKHRSPLHGSVFSVIVYGCPPRQSLNAQSWQPLPRSGCTSGRCPSFEAQHRGPITSALSTSHSGALACPVFSPYRTFTLDLLSASKDPLQISMCSQTPAHQQGLSLPLSIHCSVFLHSLFYHLTPCISLFSSFPHWNVYCRTENALCPASLISIVVVTLL